MARATWQGYIAIGQLGIPVRLYAATQSMRPKFVQLHEKDGSPVERELFCQAEGHEIDSSEIIRAVEYEPGKYITLTDEELTLAASGPIKTIAIQQFCELAAIAPLYFDKPFYIVPTRGGERAYALLREVLERTHKIAAVRFVIYGKERIAVITAQQDLLILQQLRFATEIVPRSSIKSPPLPKPTPTEIETFSAVVERYSGPFYIEDYHDEHSEHVLELIEHKAKGLKAPRRERIAPHATPEGEIITALEGTLQDIQGQRNLHKSF